jgi:hypothetical protein
MKLHERINLNLKVRKKPTKANEEFETHRISCKLDEKKSFFVNFDLF